MFGINSLIWQTPTATFFRINSSYSPKHNLTSIEGVLISMEFHICWISVYIIYFKLLTVVSDVQTVSLLEEYPRFSSCLCGVFWSLGRRFVRCERTLRRFRIQKGKFNNNLIQTLILYDIYTASHSSWCALTKKDESVHRHTVQSTIS